MKQLIPFFRKYVLLLVAILGMALYPLVNQNTYITHIFVLFFIWSVVASAWNLLNGYSGVISLGNVGFLVIGAYVAGILAKQFNVSPWLSILAGGAVTCIVVTLLLGLPALRLKGIYIGLLTMIFSDSLSAVLTQGRDITGGRMGLHAVPGFFPGMEKIHAYYICLALFLAAHWVIWRVVNSSRGLAFVALRDSEQFATSLGVNIFAERLKVFAISSFITGVAGGFYIHSLADISPTTLGVEPFLMGLAMMDLGGIGTFFGPIIGAVIIVFGGEFLRLAGTLRLTLLGLIICMTVLFFPGGIMQLITVFRRWIEKRVRHSKKEAFAEQST